MKEAAMASRTINRRVVALMTMALLAVAAPALAGCSLSGGGTTTTVKATTTTAAPPTTTTEAETTTTTATKLKFNDKGTWEGISVTVESPQTDTTPILVGAGNRVVFCMVTVINGSKDAFDYNGLDFTLTADGEEYENAGLTSVVDLGVGTLAPGETAQGAVAFEVPLAAKITSMDWQPGTSEAPVLIWGQS
jgi:hypothetical protein